MDANANYSNFPSSSQFCGQNDLDSSRPRCPTCGKGFKRMYALERHIIVHDPLRSRLEHKCPHEGCSFSTLQKSNVKAHIAAVHDKVKHICTLSRTAVDASSFDAAHPNLQCGRIFSDAPALIRHEKRAHGFYRRGAKAKAKDNERGFSRADRVEASRPASSEEQTVSYVDVPRGNGSSQSNLPGEKVHIWLRGAEERTDVEIDWDSDIDVLPRAAHSRATPHGSHASYGDHSSTSASDAESGIISSGPSSIAAPPSPLPAQTYLPPPSPYPPTAVYNTWQYYPGNTYASSNAPAEMYNLVYEEQPTSYATQNPDHTVYYNNAECLEWIPPFVDMKRVLQNSTAHQGGGEWDGVVTGLSLVD